MTADWGPVRRVFRLPFTRRRASREVDDELHFHIEGRIEELMTLGLSRVDAEAEARRRLGDIETHRRLMRAIDEETERMRNRREVVDSLRREARHATRALLRTPAFTAMTLVTLALGIGAATAIFTILDAVVLRPLPYAHGDRLVAVSSAAPGVKAAPRWGIARHELFYFKRESRTLEELGLYRVYSLTVMGDGGTHQAERARTAHVSASLFGVLGIRPLAGRLLNPDDNIRKAPSVVLLAHDYWTRRFGADPGVLGRTIDIDGFPVEVVGILPRGAQLPDLTVDLWLPDYIDPAMQALNNHVWNAIGRLRPNATAADAQRELAAMTVRFPEIFPTAYSKKFMENTGFTTEVRSLRDVVVGDLVTRALWILFASVGVVLLIAAANVANLFLVRIDARRREVALRTALGADRAHLAWYFLTESMVLSLAAAVGAVAIAAISVRALLLAAPTDLPRLGEIRLGMPGIAFAAGCALLAGAVFGSLPLLRIRLDLGLLRDGGRGLTTSRSRHAARSTLVVLQMAMALVLLAAAGLMVRSFRNLRAVQPGFDPHGVTTMTLALPIGRYQSYESVSAFYEQLGGRVKGLPGVRAVGFGQSLPIDGDDGCTAVVAEAPGPQGIRGDCVQMMQVTPGYFEALGIPVRGHAPDWAETNNRTGAAVITPTLAARFWPGEDPIGKGMRCCNATPPFYRVTGVTGDIHTQGLDRSPGQVAYFPMLPFAGTQIQDYPRYMHLVVRSTTNDDEPLISAVRRLVNELDPQVPITGIESMETLIARSLARRSFTMALLGLAAAMALLLSAVGIYGVISYVVSQRRGEIGIRMALGARGGQVRALVVRQSMTLAAVGVALGLTGAYAVTRVLGALLFGVSPMDPIVLGLAIVVLVAIASLASYAPARRASRVDPAESLRAE